MAAAMPSMSRAPHTVPAACARTSSPAPQRSLVTTGRPQASASSTALESAS